MKLIMVTCWRSLQIGMLCACLAACSAVRPAGARSTALQASAAASAPAAPQAPGVQGPFPGARSGNIPDKLSGDLPGSRPVAPLPGPLGSSGPAPLAQRPELQDFARALSDTRGLGQQDVLALLDGARYSPAVARAVSPSPVKSVRSWNAYRSRFVEPRRIRAGRDFLRDHRAVLDEAARRYGVPAEILVAIIGVETRYGKHTGSFRVLDALATLGLYYPDPNRPDRARMFREQLADFVELALGGQLDPAVQGSYAGAIGLPQFMPGSIKRYAVDGDGDGRIDLMYSVPDAVMSMGHFLREHGWLPGLPVFAPVRLPADASALVDGGLTPHLEWKDLLAAGADATTGDAAGANAKAASTAEADAAAPSRDAAWQRAPLGVIDLVDQPAGTVQYRTATPNFFALTQYNRSYFYAAAVADLAAAIAQGAN